MTTEEKIKIFNSCKNITQVLIKISKSDNNTNRDLVKKMAIDIGFDINQYNKKIIKYCDNCGLILNGKHQKKFCSSHCSTTYNNKRRVVSEKTKEKIKSTLKAKYPQKEKNEIKKRKIKEKIKRFCLNCGCELLNKDSKNFCSPRCTGDYKHKKSYEDFLNNNEKYCKDNYTPKSYKDFFMAEQNNKCVICGCKPFWNNKTLVFVIDHIDGDASNNSRRNLRMICPNCDSQTETFKSKNKNSKRRNYWKNKIINSIK